MTESALVSEIEDVLDKSKMYDYFIWCYPFAQYREYESCFELVELLKRMAKNGKTYSSLYVKFNDIYNRIPDEYKVNNPKDAMSNMFRIIKENKHRIPMAKTNIPTEQLSYYSQFIYVYLRVYELMQTEYGSLIRCIYRFVFSFSTNYYHYENENHTKEEIKETLNDIWGCMKKPLDDLKHVLIYMDLYDPDVILDDYDEYIQDFEEDMVYRQKQTHMCCRRIYKIVYDMVFDGCMTSINKRRLSGLIVDFYRWAELRNLDGGDIAKDDTWSIIPSLPHFKNKA